MRSWRPCACLAIAVAAFGCGPTQAPEGGAAAGTDMGATQACTPEPPHHGEATYYTAADGSGNCSFDPSPDDPLVAAMNRRDYGRAAACGACVRVDGPQGSVTVRIVDRCPECPRGDLDLSPTAFDRIARRSAGRVAIDWQYVACPVSGPIAYHFKEGSNRWWSAVQVRNHRFRITKLEYQKAGRFVEVSRAAYNYFVEPRGMGPGPYVFRVTDVNGAELVDASIAFHEASEVAGTQQLPACSP